MGRQKGPRAKRGDRPQGAGAPSLRSGQGAGSAFNEMLRRQAQNPRPGGVQAAPSGKDRPVSEPRPPGRRRAS
jgi:hypothetical protein